MSSDQIETEYGARFPIRRDFPFGGEPYRKEYAPDPKNGQMVDFTVYLERRSAQLGALLKSGIDMLRGTTVTNSKTLYTIANSVLEWERIGKMHNYVLFYDFVKLLLEHQNKLLYANSKDWTLDKLVKVLVPKLKIQLRVTPMGPEPNQVNEICSTQVDAAGRSQFDQCKNVYSMCQNKRDSFGMMDQTADLNCVRYIKQRVFPEKASVDPDVRDIFATYNYARDGRAYLKTVPDLRQHPWVDTEYDPYSAGNRLTQWDNQYLMPTENGQMPSNWKAGDAAPASWEVVNQADRGWRTASRAAGQQGLTDALTRRENNAAAIRMAMTSDNAAAATRERRQAENELEISAKRARMQSFRPDSTHEDSFSRLSRTAKASAVVVPRATPRRR